MSTDREERFWKNAFTDAPSPKKKNRERNSLSPIVSEGRGASVSVTDVFTGYMLWKVGQIGEKTSLYKQKRIREERADAPLLFALNNTNSHSSIVSFLPALSQLKLA